ncbi:hypothetical protein BH18CHL2_BH18CHL2_08980 [soil metagenome]
MTRLLALVAALAVAASSLALSSQPAAAHERRTVGPYQLVVGWLSEPALAGIQNAVDVRVTDTRSNGSPVEGLERTLAVDITQGGRSAALALPLRTRFGMPGAYAADLVPTREGDYTFRLKGKIESTDVDERFESGPGRFDEVRSAAALQYPDQVPTGAGLASALSELRATADQTRVFALAGLVVASLALAATLLKRRA